MGLRITYDEGQTPLDEEELDGLAIYSISTRHDLDEFEQHNIEEAMQWLMEKKVRMNDLLSVAFVKEMHFRMYGNVWNWAGVFRKTNKIIGINHSDIPIELKKLLDDVKFWIGHQTYLPDEIVIRFKHRLVSIHCFPNGNGRHSRLMADVMIREIFKMKEFTWGAHENVKNARIVYLDAVKAADKGDYGKLVLFARS